jgi:DNA-binding NtrC family response regulator
MQQKIRLLIVDDEDAFRELLLRRFERPEFTAMGARSGEEALELMKANMFDVGVIDIRMPGISGIDLLREIKLLQPDFEAIMLTGQATIDTAIEAMKMGAHDYMTKPCKLFELEIIIRKAYEKKMLAEQNAKLRAELKQKAGRHEIIGSSPAMRELREKVNNLALLDEPALIRGEGGSGKELAARCIHYLSSRKENPFYAINCGVLTEGMLEVELFGHEAMAFVGAAMRKKGLIESAAGGAVLLNEAEQIPPAMQVKILSYLETGEFRRVGGEGDVAPGVRLLFATSEDARQPGGRERFRDDFFYKISTLTLNNPALREHKDDIPELAQYIIKHSNIPKARNKRIAKKAMDALLNYNWPSNTRELINVLERAVGLTTRNVIQVKDLPISFEKKSKTGRQRHLQSLSEIEREHILHVLDAVSGNISQAARILGISRPKLYRKQERYRSGAGPEKEENAG